MTNIELKILQELHNVFQLECYIKAEWGSKVLYVFLMLSS